jgi:hypothetical protein
MSAVRVANTCYDKWQPMEALRAALRNDIDALVTFPWTEHVRGRLISALVLWDELVGEPNNGHAAIADLLICRAAHAALSANFDPLIEQWSERRKVAMQGALNGADAHLRSAGTGCEIPDPNSPRNQKPIFAKKSASERNPRDQYFWDGRHGWSLWDGAKKYFDWND